MGSISCEQTVDRTGGVSSSATIVFFVPDPASSAVEPPSVNRPIAKLRNRKTGFAVKIGLLAAKE